LSGDIALEKKILNEHFYTINLFQSRHYILYNFNENGAKEPKEG